MEGTDNVNSLDATKHSRKIQTSNTWEIQTSNTRKIDFLLSMVSLHFQTKC